MRIVTVLALVPMMGITLSSFADEVWIEDFDALTLGDTTGINQPITDGSYDAGLRLHNHLVGEVVTPNAAFTSASGNAFQLTTGTNPTGGWGLLSADNNPLPVSLIEGEDIVLSFDLYVQAVPEGVNSIELRLTLTGGDDQTRAFTEFTGASVGDVIHVTWTRTVTAGMVTATAISPRISFEGHQNNFSTVGPNGDGTQVEVAQIDNLQLVIPNDTTPPGSTTYYLDADGGSNGNSGTSPSDAWASLDHASAQGFLPGDRLLLQRGDTFPGKLVLDNDNGTDGNPIVIASYGAGDRPVIDAAGYLAGVHITSCDHIRVQDLEITGDGGVHVDGSDGTDRYGVYINNTSGGDSDGITISNVYFQTIYPYASTPHEGHNPTTYLGSGVEAVGQSSNPSEDLEIVDCHFENLGYRCVYLRYQNNTRIIDNLMENIGGPAMTPNGCDDLLVSGNIVDGSGQYTDPRMHGRGSGIWPINCNRVLIEKNAFMHARGRYDSCGVHLDIGNTDTIVQYNLSVDNEGGFVEILGVNQNCAYRYNISINDGARRDGLNENGLNMGDGHTLLFSGHNFSGQDREGPYNSYIYNNTIYVKEDQLCSFSIEQTTLGILVANNLFFIDGPSEDESPLWRGPYPPGMPDTVLWTNNLYQRAQIFPDDWVFTEGNPIYGNPNLTNPGGVTAADYIPLPGAFVEGRGIHIPLIPGDTNGLLMGLAVSNDYFGNPIQGLPDIGAVEIGGGTSTVLGAAFFDRPAALDNTSVGMTALAVTPGSDYQFTEVTGTYGGTSSGWQSGTNYSDTGLLPNTPYAYTVTVRDPSDVIGGTSVVEFVTPPSVPPFPDHIILEEDFSSRPDPANATSPFPVNTWYLDGGAVWSAEGQDGSVTDQPDETLMLGFGYDEVVLQYYSDQTWDTSRDYEFAGDWEIDTLFTHHEGVIVGVSSHHPVTGALLARIKEITVGELGSPVVGQTGSFTLSVSAAELQTAGVNPASRVGVFLHRDDDGVLFSQSADKSDIYLVDNVVMRFSGDDVDSDLDGIPDETETANGLDPNDPADGMEDADLDGQHNAGEYQTGNGIQDPNDYFKVRGTLVGGNPAITVPAANVLSNRLYILEYKGSLQDPGEWIPVDSASGTAEAGNGDYDFLWPAEDAGSVFRVRVEWE